MNRSRFSFVGGFRLERLDAFPSLILNLEKDHAIDLIFPTTGWDTNRGGESSSMGGIIDEMIRFFDGYVTMNRLTNRDDVRVITFRSRSRNVLIVRVMESLGGRPMIELNVEPHHAVLSFRIITMTDAVKNAIRKVTRHHPTVRVIGTQVTVRIVDPLSGEIERVFSTLEPFCRKDEIPSSS